jgi:ABC-type polysaccharide/polyol phosphate transport system ATPase subunit
MDITMIGLQNAGKTSLLRVLAVSAVPPRVGKLSCNIGARAVAKYEQTDSF